MCRDSHGLTDEEHALLRKIIDAPQAWCAAAKLEKGPYARARLDSLAARGWVEHWHQDRRGKPLVYRSWTLTPWGAAKLGQWIFEIRGVAVWASSRGIRGAGPRLLERPGRSERRLPVPEQIPDIRHSRDHSARFIASRYWGETTGDIDRAERLLGVPVRIVDVL